LFLINLLSYIYQWFECQIIYLLHELPYITYSRNNDKSQNIVILEPQILLFDMDTGLSFCCN